MSFTWGANDGGALDATLCISEVKISTSLWAAGGIWDRSPVGCLGFAGGGAGDALDGWLCGGGGREACGGP